MEEVIKEFKEAFAEYTFVDRNDKLAYAIGYLEDCDDVNRKEAIQILRKIFLMEI